MARNQTDYLTECNRQGVPVAEFEQTFCQRCKQVQCRRAAWGSSRMDQRVQEQVERLLHPMQADPTLSKYGHLVDFKSMFEHALRMEEANRRGDWEIPEIPVSDGVIEVSSAASVDAAVRAMKIPPSQGGAVEAKPDAIADGLPDPKTPVEVTPPEPAPHAPSPAPSAPVQKGPRVHAPTATNTPVEQGQMVGGGPPPTPPVTPPSEGLKAVDPWAPPPPDPAQKVRVGATVRMGGK